MKIKTFTIVLAVSFAFVFNAGFAQEVKLIPGVTASQISHSDFIYNAKKNNIPSRALRHFGENFKNVELVSWLIRPNESIATFYENKQQQMVYYTPKGNWMYTVRNYFEDKLPKKIAQTVKGSYWAYSITHCSQIDDIAGSVYIVSVLKDKDLKILRVEGDEINILNEYNYVGGKTGN